MRDILDDPTDEDDDYPSPGSELSAVNHQSFIFGYSATMITLRILHPPSKQVMTYWDIFKANVDPLTKLIHKNNFEKVMLEASENLDHLSKATEVLMFSIYYAAVTTLNPDECQSILQLDKDIALKRYRFGVEQALAKADFLGTLELQVVQAFILFLVCVRRHDHTRFVWTLTGTVIRLAQSLGIHRDGSNFNLAPYETEIRRRIWWQVCTLGKNTSEVLQVVT